MTFSIIREYFEGDNDLLKYYDPTSSAKNNDEASLEIYLKLVEHTYDRPCQFVYNEIGYLFFSENILISFCIKKECRNKKNLIAFGEFIKQTIGEHIHCVLFNHNERAINYLKMLGMQVKKKDDLITHLFN